jgi:hypothetical protein
VTTQYETPAGATVRIVDSLGNKCIVLLRIGAFPSSNVGTGLGGISITLLFKPTHSDPDCLDFPSLEGFSS